MSKPEYVPTIEEQKASLLKRVAEAKMVGIKHEIPLTIVISVNTEMEPHLADLKEKLTHPATFEVDSRLVPGANLAHVSTPEYVGS